MKKTDKDTVPSREEILALHPGAEPCIVACESRVLLYGLVDQDKDPTTIHRAQMIVYYPKECKGVVGLAAKGPMPGSRITAQVPYIKVVSKIEGILRCTEKAALEIEKAPWTA